MYFLKPPEPQVTRSEPRTVLSGQSLRNIEEIVWTQSLTIAWLLFFPLGCLDTLSYVGGPYFAAEMPCVDNSDLIYLQ